MASFGGFDFNHSSDSLSRQIAGLSRDAAHISHALARYTSGASHDAGHAAQHFADTALHQGARAARLLGKQAGRAGKAVGRDPVPAVIAVAGLACLISLVMASGRRR